MKNMNKSVTVGMCGFLAWAAGSMAEEPTSLLAGKAPAGLRLAWDRLRSSIPTPRYAPSKSTPTVAGSGVTASNKMSLASAPVPTDRTKSRPPEPVQSFRNVEMRSLQGNRIKKRGHPERSAARAKAGRHGVEGSRESWQDHQTRPNIVPAFHGILRLRDARHLRPPGIAPPQNDPVFF